MMKVFAQSGRISVNAATGAVTRSRNPQSEFYRRMGTTNLGGNARTRGRQRPIQRVAR
jgi:hypothetical protein